MPKHLSGIRIAALIAAAASVTAVSACSSSGGSNGGATSAAAPAPTGASQPAATGGSGTSLKSELPADIQSKGSIDVAAVSDYPPISYSEAGSTDIKGVAIDLLNAAADALGVTFNYKNTSFDSLIPSLQAGRELIASGGTTDTPTNEKAALMVDFMKAGVQLIVPSDNPKNITGLDTACGHTVAVLAGSATYTAELNKASSACTSAGKPKITISTFKTADEALLALKAGRTDAEFDSNVLQAYRIRQGVDVKVVGKTYAPVPIAFQVLPQNKQVATALKDAIQELIDNGTYKKILADWKMESGALDAAGINLGSSSS